jgi:hypothetical protein
MNGGSDAVDTFSVQPSRGCDDAVEITRLYLDFLEVPTPNNKMAEPLAYNVAGSDVGAEVLEEVAVKVALRLYIGDQ